MQRPRPLRILLVALAAACLLWIVPASADAAPIERRPSPTVRCLPVKHVEQWRSVDQLERLGFNVDLIGAPQASLSFSGSARQSKLSLDLAADPAVARTVASRVTEIVDELPIAERVKCWQPKPGRDVVVEYTIRFDQAATPPNLVEAAQLWNAPFPGAVPEAPIPVTSIGVIRSSLLGAPMYIALVTQDFDYATFSGFVQVVPMPAWLDASRWHSVRIILSQTSAQIDVAQGARGYEPVLQVTMPRPADPLGFEFSVDTDQPVVVPDGLDVRCLSMRTMPAALHGLQQRLALCKS
jgi:hypothetical protein